MKHLRYIIPLALILFTAVFTMSFQQAESASTKVNWMTWEEALAASKKDTVKKKFFVDIYTNWCGWCKRMDETTFKDPKVVKILNEQYYPIKFNAESKEDITVNGVTYKFVKERDGKRWNVHELAVELLNGKLSYPSVVFLNEKTQIIQPVPGYQPANTFSMIASYFGEDHFKKTPWKDYEKSYGN